MPSWTRAVTRAVPKRCRIGDGLGGRCDACGSGALAVRCVADEQLLDLSQAALDIRVDVTGRRYDGLDVVEKGAALAGIGREQLRPSIAACSSIARIAHCSRTVALNRARVTSG